MPTKKLTRTATTGNGAPRRCARLEAARLDVRVTRGDQNDVSNLVSEAMILCGELIARFGTENNVPLPYRGQNEPKEFALKSLARGASGAVHGGAQEVHHARREPRCDTA